jgi:hypothetical protein
VLLLQAIDEAGPLWLLFESSFEWLGFWGRIAVLAGFALAIVMAIVLMPRRKS